MGVYTKWLFYRIKIIVIAIIVNCNYAVCQEIKLGGINYENYPILECPFIYKNVDGAKNFTLQVQDFSILEDNKSAEIVEVINPEGEGKPVSVVLVFDVSSSMQNERLALAKESAIEFLKQFPLETSEVAVASFSDEVYLNCDFTQDEKRLSETIQDLGTFSGTNYTNAFLDNRIGGLDIARNGKHKKAIVFLTDGLSNANSETIIKRAIYEGVTVYCITLALKTPQVLKDIAINTGGRYYEAVSNIYQLHNFYASICQLLQTSGYSIIRWRANPGCETKRKVNLKCKTLPVEFVYDVPANIAGYLQTDPNIISFKSEENTEQITSSVTLSAIKQAFSITDIKVGKKSYFTLMDTFSFPHFLKQNESLKLNIAYLNNDAGIVSDKLIISSLGCPPATVTLNGGTEEQLKIISPRGGEVYPVGLDTAIIWEGIRRNKLISLSYSVNGMPWNFIGDGKGLYSKWIIPNDTGQRVRVKAEPLFSYDRDFKNTNRLVLKGSVSDISSNDDGSLLVTIDKFGTLQLWDGNTSKLLITVGGFALRHAILSPDSKRIIAFTGFEMFVWDIATLKLIARYTYRQKLFVSDVDPDGFETLLPTRIYKGITDKTKAWSPGSNILIPLPEQKDLTSASVVPGGLKAITINVDNQLKIFNLSDNKDIANIKLIRYDITSVVISPDGKYFVMFLNKYVKVYSLNTGKEVFELPNDVYKKFFRNGKIMVTSDGSQWLNFWELSKGKRLFELERPAFYKTASESNKILYYKGNTLVLKDLFDESPEVKIVDNDIIDAALSPNDRLILALNKMNGIDVYDVTEGKKINTLNEFDSQVKQVKFSANGKNIFVVTENNEVLVFKPFSNKKLKAAVSNEFSIVAPKLKVKEVIQFEPQLAGSYSELFVKDFAVNISKFPVLIKNMKIVGADSATFKLVSGYCPFSVDGNSGKEAEIAFNPVSKGRKNAILVTYTATDSLFTRLIGETIEPEYRVNVKGIDFGVVKAGTIKDSVAVVLINAGTNPFKINTIENSGPNKDQFVLGPYINDSLIGINDSLKIGLTFKPKYRGRLSGGLTIKIKGIKEPQKIFLYGEATASREVVLMGRTLNTADSLPISAKFSCNDLVSGTKVYSSQTPNDGKYRMVLSADRNYGISAEKENYLSGSENIDLTDAVFDDTINKDIYLTELKTGAMVRMNCVFFDFGKWNLLPSSEAELNRLSETLQKYPKINIELHGHTDSIGSNQSNLILSKNRVTSVRNYLIKKGIAASRMGILFFGENKPVTTNTIEQGRAQNRRVEVKVR